jgi:hypothetical protein
VKVTKRQLKQIIKEELTKVLREGGTPGHLSSEDIMAKLEALGWSEELSDAVGDPTGAQGYLGASPEQEEEYDTLIKNPDIQDLLKQYAVVKSAESRTRSPSPPREPYAGPGHKEWIADLRAKHNRSKA